MSDCPRQNKVNRSIAHFFVVPNGSEHIFAADSVQGGQSAKRGNGVFNAGPVMVFKPFKRTADTGSGDHSIADRLAVSDSLISSGAFQPMSNGMAKIKNPPKVALFLIGHDHFRLNCRTACHKALYSPG